MGLCAHCLLCLHWSLCLFFFIFVHIKYTGVCVPGLALIHLCFFYFGAPFLEAAGGQAPPTPYRDAVLSQEGCWVGPLCGEGSWPFLTLLFTISALTVLVT